MTEAASPTDDPESRRQLSHFVAKTAVIVAGSALVGLVDFVTGIEIRVFALYYLPIAYAAWHFGRKGGGAAVILATGVWVASNVLSGRHYSHTSIWVINAVVQGIAFTVVAILIAVLRERELRERSIAGLDSLTSLLNRRAFFDTGNRIVERCRRMTRPVTIAYIDLDDFKLVNDRAGHLAGDQLLREVADLIKLAVRPGDLVARFGGDEFVVLLPELAAHDALPVLERVRTAIEHAFQSQEQPVRATIGAAAFKSLPGLETMIVSADDAMYAAKRAGRNRVHMELVHPAIR